LAKAYTGSIENQHFVEAAYNVLSDLGEVSRHMVRSGLAGLKRVMPIPGTPVRMMLAARAHDLNEVPTHMRGEMFIEYKYDGERVQIHRDGNGAVHAFSRRLERITHQYPEIIDAFAKSDVPKNTILEGEIAAFDFKTEHLLYLSDAHATPTQTRHPHLHQEDYHCALRVRFAALQESQPPRSTTRGTAQATATLHQTISAHSFVEIHCRLGHCSYSALFSPGSPMAPKGS
jgi:ATP-dependent DNA ligase